MAGLLTPELRSITCADYDPLEEWQPSDPESFYLAIETEIGPVGHDWCSLFSFQVVSPKWLVEHGPPIDQHGQGESIDSDIPVLWGFSYIMLWRWDFSELVQVIEDRCSMAIADDWDSAAQYLAHYGSWELDPSWWRSWQRGAS